MAKFCETITVHRNGCLREWEFDFGTNMLHDIATGEVSQSSYDGLTVLKSDLKRQGFRFLPYNPDRVVMTPAMREDFRNIFGY